MIPSIFLPLLPLLSSFFLLLFGAKLRKKAVAILGIIGIGASALYSMVLFYQSLFVNGERQVFWTILSNKFLLLPKIDFAFYVDPIAIVMSMMVSFVSFWIALYSTIYMKNEQGYVRFFVVINLFVSFMLLLVLADNLFLLFMAWEGVGICSYLLIGFYYTKNEALQAAMKAFLTTRVGDLFLLLAMILSVFYLGTSDIKAIISSSVALDNQVPCQMPCGGRRP
jgi:NADH-quinone oxidoreductase subunit L